MAPSRKMKRGKMSRRRGKKATRRVRQRGGGSVDVTYKLTSDTAGGLVSSDTNQITVTPVSPKEIKVVTVGATKISNIQIFLSKDGSTWTDISNLTAGKPPPVYAFSRSPTHVRYSDLSKSGMLANITPPGAKLTTGTSLGAGVAFTGGLRLYNLEAFQPSGSNGPFVKITFTTVP
jgi:hypothetical protein